MPKLLRITFRIMSLFSILMSIYFFYMRFDVVTRLFKRGIFDFGEMLLPCLLMIIGVVLFLSSKAQKK